MRIQRTLLTLSLITTFIQPLWAQQHAHDGGKKFPSPDGKFAFRYAAGKPTEETEEETEVFNLVNRGSGKVLLEVAKSDPDFGPSGRFEMKVLWKPDSKAFAVTATLTRRGSTLLVFVRNGAEFRAIEVPELEVEITEEAKQGKEFGKTTWINSQTAKRWQKDGSLVVDIETVESGGYGTITATRTVVLGFDKTDKARILRSSIKFAIEKG
jgi:hypothetical protein